MNKLRIDTGVVNIEVNDNGDMITLRLGDQQFLKNIFEMIRDFEKKTNETVEAISIIDDLDDDERLMKKAQKSIDTLQYFKQKIDEVFGEDTCKKVFGDITPDMRMYADFIEAIKPYMNQYINKQNDKINKYTSERTGNV